MLLIRMLKSHVHNQECADFVVCCSVSDVNIILYAWESGDGSKNFLWHKYEMRLLLVLHVGVNALLSFVYFCEDMFGDGRTAETCSIIMWTWIFTINNTVVFDCWQFSSDNKTGWSCPRIRWVVGMLKFYTLTLQQYWSMAATKGNIYTVKKFVFFCKSPMCV
jgi:hypothetical protein